MTKAIPTHKTGRSTASSSVDLSSVLTNWSQAAQNFHALYGVLRETIANRQQASQLPNSVTQYSLSELEKVQEMMVREISSLINAIDTPLDLSPESASRMVKHLRSHTMRLQKQANRIKRALWLSSLGAS